MIKYKSYFLCFFHFFHLVNPSPLLKHIKNVKKLIHITENQVIKRLDGLFFYGSDNFIVKPPTVMSQMMQCLQRKCTKIDFLLIFDILLSKFLRDIFERKQV